MATASAHYLCSMVLLIIASFCVMHTYASETTPSCTYTTTYSQILMLLHLVNIALNESLAREKVFSDTLVAIQQARARADDESTRATTYQNLSRGSLQKVVALNKENQELKDRLVKLRRTNKRLRCILASQQRQKKKKIDDATTH
jgi:hypothetical protein